MTSLYTGPDRGDAVNETTSLDELRRLSEAATPGPWRLSDDDPTDVVIWGAARDSWVANVDARNIGGWYHDPVPPDAHFIVAAVNYVRAALRDSHDRP